MKFSMFQFQSLKTRVTIFTLVVFLVGIWSLAYYSGRMLRDDLQRMLGEQQFSTVSIVAADINREIDFRFRALEKIAEGITPTILNDTRKLQSLLEERPLLQNLFNGGCYVIQGDGVTIADFPVSTGRVGMNVSEKGWMIEALKGKSTIGKPVIGAKLKVPVFTIATPVRDTAGNVIGVLAGVVNLSSGNFLDKTIGNSYGKSGGYVLIAPEHRLIVTATDKSRIMQTIPAPGINPLMDRYIQGFEGSGRVVDSRGLDVLSAAKQIPAAGWVIVARITAEEAFAPIHNMQHRMLLAAIILTFLAGGVIWWMLKRQLSPILSAVETLSAISDSDLPVSPLPMKRQDEVGQLIGGFNRLLETLALREAKLIESDDRHRSILQTAINGIWLTDMQGRLIEVNGSYCRLSGYSEQELLTMNISDLEVNESADDVASHLQLIRERGEARFESRHRCKDGTVFDIEINAQYRTTDGGQCIAFMQDISERKMAEEEKIQLQSQLHQTQKMESVGSLAGGVAHDFNNKLSVILGYAHLAEAASDPVEIHNYLAEIRKAGEQSADLTRQLLAFARKQTIAPRVLDLNETVAGMLKMLKRLIGEDIHLIWQPATDLWRIKMDPSQIDQILANLCINARDSIDGVGSITIETGNGKLDKKYCDRNPGALPGDCVWLLVSDDGCGMDKKTIEHIFEPFFTTKEMGKGTGLGLATVFGIVKQNNGFISVQSEPGLGTTFTIYLPRYIGKSEQAQKEGVSMPAPRGLETILLVEDDLAIINMAEVMLTKQGYTVLSANTPAEAIRLAKENAGKIDLLITDVIMPEMNGKELANNLQSLQPELKCLFMSGYTTDAIAKHGVLDEGVNFIPKPFSLPDIAAKVREVLNG